MKFYIYYVSSVLCYLANVSTEPNGGKSRSLPVVDAFISRLQQQRWEPADVACLRATLDMLEGVKNNTLWATWVWDSMQLPMGSLYGVQGYIGNYDQCLQAPWYADKSHPGFRSQYCLVDVKWTNLDQAKSYDPNGDTQNYYRTPTSDGRPFNHHYFGACFPSICSTSVIANISQHLLLLTHLPDGVVTVDPENCRTAGEVVEYPAGVYVFWLLVSILFVTTIISTLFNNDATTQTALDTVAKSFCVKRNYRSLFTVGSDEVRVMHGMRFITAVIIVCCHEVFVAMFCPTINGLAINKFLTSPLGLSFMHLEVVVDTFFAMSGMLLVRSLLMGKQKNIFYNLVKRYIRLIGPYALCILYYATTIKYMNSGPLWKMLVQNEVEGCEQYWWKSLLMANNDVTTLCYSVTWYISCDYQMAILGSCLFYLFRKNRRLGVAALVSVGVALTVNLGLNVYWKRLDILPFSFKAISFKRQYTEINDTYLSFHVRTGPYLVGMVMGYIITKWKPAEHRNFIGKKWSVVIATMAILVNVIVLTIAGILALMGRPYDPLEAALVVATNRTIWGIMICSLIGVCEYGSLTLIPSILSWGGFVPLSKLSYCIYLLHFILLQHQKFSARNPAEVSAYNMVLNVCGVTVLSCILSLVLHLILEAPLINISNALFTVKSKQLEQNVTKGDMNQNTTSVQRLEQNGPKSKLS